MINKKFGLAVVLGLIGLLTPSAARADEIVAISLSNLTFTGNSVCGPSGSGSGTSPCIETFNGSVLWDNTTGATVPNSAQSTTAGPISGVSFGGGGLFFGFKGSAFDWNNGTDAFVIELLSPAPGIAPGIISPGSYPLVLSLDILGNTPESLANLDCSSLTCQNDFALGDNLTTTGTITVSPVPEPATLLLLGTGLLTLVDAARRKRLA